MKLWQIIEKRWQDGGIYSNPNEKMSVPNLHRVARNEIFDLLDRIRELENVCSEVNDYIDNLDTWEDSPPDELQAKIKNIVYNRPAA